MSCIDSLSVYEIDGDRSETLEDFFREIGEATIAALTEGLGMTESATSKLVRSGQAYLRSVAQTHGLTLGERPWTEVTRLRVVTLGCEIAQHAPPRTG